MSREVVLRSLKDAQRRRRKRVHTDPNQRTFWEDLRNESKLCSDPTKF